MCLPGSARLRSVPPWIATEAFGNACRALGCVADAHFDSQRRRCDSAGWANRGLCRRDDSTFLLFSDAQFGNTLLLPNRNLDKAYQKLDLSGSFRVNHYLNLYASMENLLNQRYDPAFGFPAPLFTLRGGIKIRLGGESWHKQ